MPPLEQRRLPKAKGKPKHSLDAFKATQRADRKWKKKMADKEKIGRVRALSKQLKEDMNQEMQRVSAARKANQQRKLENEKKNMVVQTIKNEKAMKKLSPKHRHKARIFMLHELN